MENQSSVLDLISHAGLPAGIRCHYHPNHVVLVQWSPGEDMIKVHVTYGGYDRWRLDKNKGWCVVSVFAPYDPWLDC